MALRKGYRVLLRYCSELKKLILFSTYRYLGYGLPPGVEDLQSDALPIVDAKITTPSIEALESYVAVQAEQQMKGAANAILRQLANPTKVSFSSGMKRVDPSLLPTAHMLSHSQ